MSIPATLSLARAAARRWPTVVVGAGPAGAVLAGLLARRGVAVLLVDRGRFPRFKVCGACLNGRALAALQAAGLGELPHGLGAHPLSALHLSGGGRAVRVALPGGMALSRAALDAALVEAAVARGADFLPATAAAPGGVDEGTRRVVLRGAEGEVPLAADVVVAADGLAGGLLARAGQPSLAEPAARVGAGVIVEDREDLFPAGIIRMAWGTHGYVGAVRLEDGRLNFACALDADSIARAGPGPVAARLLHEASFPVPAGLEGAAWRGTPPLTRRPRRVAHHRLFVVGDAGGYVEPFTGEGMAWAMASAVALAPLVHAATVDWRRGLVAAWQARHRRVVVRRQGPCRAAAAALRRPWLMAAATRALAWFPGLARPVLAHLNGADADTASAPGDLR